MLNYLAIWTILGSFIWFCNSATVTWKADSISYTSTSHLSKPKVWSSTVTITSTGLIYPKDTSGNFAIQITAIGNYTSFNGTSDCISANANVIQASAALNSMELEKYGNFYDRAPGHNGVLVSHVSYGTTVLFSDLFSLSIKKLADASSHTTSYKMTITSNSKEFDNIIHRLDFNVTTTGCVPARSIGYWDDVNRWSTGALPTMSDAVVIPAGSGIVQLVSDVSVGSLTVAGGYIFSYTTACPDGWTLDPTGVKCYLLHQELLAYSAADTVCNSVGFSSSDAHLIQIRDRNEMISALRICRGPVGSPAYIHGCWIGLRSPDASGKYDWIVTDYVGSSMLFLDWRRGEPNNHTSSDGIPTNGELCGKIIAWQEDPLIEEQGSWNDESCNAKKPFICQIYSATVRYDINTTGIVTLSGGEMDGGRLLIGSGVSNIAQFTVNRGAIVTFSPLSSGSNIHQLILSDGSELHIEAQVVNFFADAFVGELIPAPSDPPVFSGEMQSRVFVKPGCTMEVKSPVSGGSVMNVNARVILLGSLLADSNSVTVFLQGGEFSQAKFSIHSGARVDFNGYGARLSSVDAFELTLSNRGPFIGEYYGSTNGNSEADNIHDLTFTGVFRIKISQHIPKSSQTNINITSCIPYNATVQQLTDILNAMPLIKERGGVTVRQYGDKDNSRYGYGFTYRIQLDAPQTDTFPLGPLDMSIYGYGLDYGCAETKVPLTDETGDKQCPSDIGVIAAADPDACVYPPTIGITRISSQSFTNTTGTGVIRIANGVHRLPPISLVEIQATAGTGIVAADYINWYSLSSTQIGRLVLAGTGWLAWDSANVLYAPDWTTERGLVKALSHAPPFNMFAQRFNLDGYGSILSACPTSNMTWISGTWGGGFIGGRSTLYITNTMNAQGTNKALRFGLTLYIMNTAKLNWYTGNISLADGADIIMEGVIQVNATDLPVFIGEVQLLTAPDDDIIAQQLLEIAGGRNFHSYYGDELVAELRGGWYQNPLCGDQCFDTNQIVVRGSGYVKVSDYSKVNFFVPLNLIGNTALKIGHNVDITLQSGGTCGDGVIMDISHDTNLMLTGGQMAMQAKCIIRGDGELLVTDGSHDLAFSIDSHITILGGAMVWPLSRGTHGTLTFNGGLLIKETGKLSVEPASTDIVVHGEVQLQDESLVQFPLLGVAAQASPFDEQDAPDTSPRGSFTATGVMKWLGGTLLGKADFNVLQALYLDGTVKYISSLAKLVNKGHCEWGNGNIISDNNGDFLNFGTIQMTDGVALFDSSAMYKGTELPLSNGGDVFALEYHSYDMDNGGLSYDQYVQLRTEFVSRAPTKD